MDMNQMLWHAISPLIGAYWWLFLLLIVLGFLKNTFHERRAR